jgi:hypothetical protein
MGISDVLSILKVIFSGPKLNTHGSLSCRSIGKSVNNLTTYGFLISIKIFNDRKNQANRPQILKFKLSKDFEYKWDYEFLDSPITNAHPLKFDIQANIDIACDSNVLLSDEDKVSNVFANIDKEYNIEINYHDEFRSHTTNLKGILTLGKTRLVSIGW